MSAEHATQFYIGGEWRDPSTPTRIDVVDPTTEAVVGQIAAGGPQDVDLAVAAATSLSSPMAGSERSSRARSRTV